MDHVLSSAVAGLAGFVATSVARRLELVRIARVSCVLGYCGLSVTALSHRASVDYVVAAQRTDGGWSDPEETAWAVGLLKLRGDEYDVSIRAAIEWLEGVRMPGGGWGRHVRDQARIPVTTLVAVFVPEVVRAEDMQWLRKEWRKDFEGQVRLSYKGGFYLMATAGSGCDDLNKSTMLHLREGQNEDGGFGPWRDHPIGSDPWSTGIVLRGLVSHPEIADRHVVEKAVKWLAARQLPNGLWPYHYIEEGSAYAYWGLVEALKFLAKGSA